MHGEGKYSYATGDVYEGYFKEGLMHGTGHLTLISPTLIELLSRCVPVFNTHSRPAAAHT